MSKIISLLIFTLIAPCCLRSQILPIEGSKLNYRLIGFSFPQVQKTSKFTIEIAGGNYNAEDSFKKNIIRSLLSKDNKIVAEVPAFGMQYTWRVVCADGSNTTTGGLHHFSTSSTAEADTSMIRLRIIKHAVKYKDAYVFLDGNRALYDMEGHPVWFLPDVERFNAPANAPMPVAKNIVPAMRGPFIPTNDMKLTPQGTITFVFYETAYEINYNGDILWKAPDQDKLKGEKREFYHHEFTRLANGHYMALKNEFENVCWTRKHNSSNDTGLALVPANEINKDDKNVFYRKTEFAIIKEYDQAGNVVWSWKSSKYFVDQDKGNDLDRCWKANGPFDQEVHGNSVYFDEKDSLVYIGFRNASLIIKLKYLSGEILNVYKGDQKSADNSNSLFCYQHSCRRSEKGYLYLFNNNLCNPGDMPDIQILQEPLSGKENFKIIWKYKCTYDSSDQKADPSYFVLSKGGNVLELPDQSMFVNMGSKYNKIFIVTRDKKILWSAIPQEYDPMTRKWENILQYRVSIVLSHKEIERLIWNAEGKE